MCEQITMQVGELELRRTEEGWEYLSQEADGQPGEWSDATSVLGPFGGSGVNDLLDELAAVKASKSTREAELEKALWVMRGKSSCRESWDLIDKLVPEARHQGFPGAE
ncbi:hypothetical protein [Pseudomonas aeruginosa]|uniref:hypothetical protein n=1 Tax=Pseudomonas aeruginosa TaxID=287 RepID=UPI00155E1436|nr:hypothetical protein [Pseudomonas aeruginosa]NRC34124.1 hypothetical protein [Pseudomonas aeruginosa]